MRQFMPHVGPMAMLAAGFDYAASYDAARAGRPPLLRQPAWAANRDRLHGNPARQQVRSATINAMWRGDVSRVWTDIMANQGANHFIPAFRLFLSFV